MAIMVGNDQGRLIMDYLVDHWLESRECHDNYLIEIKGQLPLVKG